MFARCPTLSHHRIPRMVQCSYQGTRSTECLFPHVCLSKRSRARKGPHRRFLSRSRLGDSSVRPLILSLILSKPFILVANQISKNPSPSVLHPKPPCIPITPNGFVHIVISHSNSINGILSFVGNLKTLSHSFVHENSYGKRVIPHISQNKKPILKFDKY